MSNKITIGPTKYPSDWHNLTAARLTRCERAIREILETIPPDGYTDTADVRAIARGVGIEPREARDE